MTGEEKAVVRRPVIGGQSVALVPPMSRETGMAERFEIMTDNGPPPETSTDTRPPAEESATDAAASKGATVASVGGEEDVASGAAARGAPRREGEAASWDGGPRTSRLPRGTGW